MKDEILEASEETCRNLMKLLSEVKDERDIYAEALDRITTRCHDAEKCVEIAEEALKTTGYA
jgi:hypothetical protein